MIELRLRNQASDVDVAALEGRLLAPEHAAFTLVGPARVLKPSGAPLAVYLPGALDAGAAEAAYPALRRASLMMTDNRGMAAGGGGAVFTNAQGGQRRTTKVRSRIAGNMEATAGRHPYCRLTSFNLHHAAEWETIMPLLRQIGRLMAEHVPERYRAQMAHATARPEAAEWLLPGTPFTTVTLNHTWATAGHYDKGDLDAGFSCLAVLRRGSYSGGQLVLPRYRLAVDMRDRDLLLMDAHELHGNVPLRWDCPTCGPGALLGGSPNVRPALGTRAPNRGGPNCAGCGADSGAARLAIVAYYRTAMARCGSVADEEARRAQLREQRNQQQVLRA